MKALRAIDLEVLGTQGEGECAALKLLEAICRHALDERSQLLCCLSAEEGEWSSSGVIKHAKAFRFLMKSAFEQSDNAFADPEWVVFAMMTKVAKEMNQPLKLPW